MNCLLSILSIEKQKNFINLIQNRDETFETELMSYKRIFLSSLELVRNEVSLEKQQAGKRENLISCANATSCYLAGICSQIYSDLFADEKWYIELSDFIKTIESCYRNWIDGNTAEALNRFEEVLLEKQIILQSDADGSEDLILHDLYNRVFFRARIMSDENEYLGIRDMFHVPYNKRYLVRNSRFGLSGQPFLYLANSIPGVLEELGIDSEDEQCMKRVQVSSFDFCDEKYRTVKKHRIFDLRCNIEDVLRHGGTKNLTKRQFYRNVLAYICSFQKNRNVPSDSFKEEYVIPQMLMQLLKKHGYDGICYYSTKFFDGYVIKEQPIMVQSEGRNLQYRENLTMFTSARGQYKKDELLQERMKSGRENDMIFDKVLFSDLEISMPISISKLHKHDPVELTSLLENIIGQTSQKRDKQKELERIREKAASIVDFYQNTFTKITINGTPYHDHAAGKVHLQLLLGVLNRLLVEAVGTP